MEKLNPKELNAARSIINIGLSRAATSLSFFMKEEIRINGLDLRFNKFENQSDFTCKFGNNIHFLVTEVIGELKGTCCLIFSEEEADHLRTAALPQDIRENVQMMAEMSDAIMLEVDNIISASVITEFSNLLGHKIYGGVPNLKKFTVNEMEEFVKQNYEKEMYIINFKSHFVSSKLDFKPDFVWLFDDSFLNSVKEFSASQSNLKKLEVA
jgi:chemotaxis protein CheY-P-specific phosphatase CheC